MAQEILVEKKMEDGIALIRELQARKFDVSAGFWMQIDDGFWHLYLASKAADEVGPSKASRVVDAVLQELPQSSIERSDIRVIKTSEPAAKEVLDLQSQFRPKLYSRQRLRNLGGLQLGEAHIYPLPLVP